MSDECYCAGGHPTIRAEEAQRRISALAAYNSEVARGILHTPEYKNLMRGEQHLFNNGEFTRLARERR